jgi:CubicO group peptidase (beta-lactamase class C family)
LTDVAVLVAALAAAGPASAQAPVSASAIDALLQPWSSGATPGCIVGVDRNGERLIRTAGYSNLELGTPITPDTVFEAGSVAKQFTAAAVLLLVQDGKLALTDDVRRHLPELPDYGATITIDHLLRHTSGLRDWSSIQRIAGEPRGSRIYTNAEVLRIASRQRRLNHPPEAQYAYTNTGYNLLAIVVERVSGESLAEFTRKRIFAPLGMTRTSWRDDFNRIVAGRATAYLKAAGGYRQSMPFENAYGNGGLLTTIGDLLLWNRAMIEDRLGASLRRQLMERAPLSDGARPAYARGLFVEDHGGRPLAWHSGSTAAYRAWSGYLPDLGYSVALLCNNSDMDPEVLGPQVLEIVLPANASASRSATPRRPRPAQAAPGVYISRATGLALLIEATEAGGYREAGGPVLEPVRGGEYSLGGAPLRFIADGRLLVGGVGGDLHDRFEAVNPSPAELAGFAGRYWSDEAQAGFAVAVAADGLQLERTTGPADVIRLRPLHRDVFLLGGQSVVRFIRADGDVIGFQLTLTRARDVEFTRTPAATTESPAN